MTKSQDKKDPKTATLTTPRKKNLKTVKTPRRKNLKAAQRKLFLSTDDFLNSIGSLVSNSELHGVMCGLICAGRQMHGKSWLELVQGVIGEHLDTQRNVKNFLLKLYQQTLDDLKNEDYTFELLLPDDNVELSERARALGEWCSGMLLGLGLADLQMEKVKEADIRNGFFHISEFAQIDHDLVYCDEQDERAYTELVEYLRTIALMFFQEFGLEAPSANHKAFALAGNNDESYIVH